MKKTNYRTKHPSFIEVTSDSVHELADSRQINSALYTTSRIQHQNGKNLNYIKNSQNVGDSNLIMKNNSELIRYFIILHVIINTNKNLAVKSLVKLIEKKILFRLILRMLQMKVF